MGTEPLRRATPGAGRPGPPEIPGYRIEAVLGRGATGVVYRAVQVSVQRKVALKVLHASAVQNERIVQRLEREARTAALLTHPNIISAIDMGRASGTCWFAMELVEGQSLAERLEHGGRLSERDALRLFVPLADALQHACEKGVVHRDVKPANILVEASGRPRLVDLGLARLDDDPALTRTGGTLGTPYYISPEQARDPGSTDIRGDIWSLGATLYHAVCGRPPFSGRGAAEILSEVLYAPIPDPRNLRPELSRGLSLVIRKCLSRDADKRYFTPAELREDLERIRDRKAPAVRESQLEPSAESGRRAKHFGVAGAVLLGVAVLGLALWRPWIGEVVQPGTPVPTASRYEPLEQISLELQRDDRDLAAAYHQLRELEPTMPVAHRARWGELHGALHAALRDELYRLRRVLDPELERALDERRFKGFAKLLDEDWPLQLGERTGFGPATLPDALSAGLEQWRVHWAARRDQAHQAAVTSVVQALERFVEEVLARRVERFAAEGRWQDARAALEGGAWAQVAEAGAVPGDIVAAELAPALAGVERRLEGLVVQLEQNWRALDQELARRVRELARETADRLRSRQALRAVEGFDAAVRAELARRGLALETWPGPPLRSELPAVEQRERDALVELEEELIAEDARAQFAAYEEQARTWMRERRFGRVRTFWNERAPEPILAQLGDRVELRAEEARVLERLMLAASEGVRTLARSGEVLTLPVGTIRAEGRVDSGSAPLQEGFRLLFAGGRDAAQRLRLTGDPDSLANGQRLSPAAVERLAEHDAGLQRDADFHLARALLRFHGGDAAGARAVIVEAQLSQDDALVHDLAVRIEESLGEVEAVRVRKRAYAERRYRELAGLSAQRGAKHGLGLVQELLGEYADVLSADELRALRDRRRELQGGGPRASLEELRLSLGAERATAVGSDRVRLRWEFDEHATGAWRAGRWRYDGRAWATPEAALDVADMLKQGGPTLLFGELLTPERGTTELLLELEQIWPPRLLLVSLCGFQVALAGAGGEGSRLLVDVAAPEVVAMRAGAGEGIPVSGLREGATHVWVVRANPSRGTLEVLLDGRTVSTQTFPPPQLDPRAAVHTFEPVRLLAAELEATR